MVLQVSGFNFQQSWKLHRLAELGIAVPNQTAADFVHFGYCFAGRPLPQWLPRSSRCFLLGFCFGTFYGPSTGFATGPSLIFCKQPGFSIARNVSSFTMISSVISDLLPLVFHFKGVLFYHVQQWFAVASHLEAHVSSKFGSQLFPK